MHVKLSIHHIFLFPAEEVNVPVIKQEYLDENNEDHMEMQLVEGTANLNEPESLSEGKLNEIYSTAKKCLPTTNFQLLL